MTTSEERQMKRIEVLKCITKLAEFNPTKVVEAKQIFETMGSLSQSEIISHVFYFREKGYLQLAPFSSNGLPNCFAWTKITSKGIDLIEKLEDGRDTTEYENDFSKQVLNHITMNIGSVNNSPFQLATQNSIQTINSNESNLTDLITILEKVKAAEPENVVVIKPIEEELKKPKIDWSKVNAYFQTLVSISSIVSSLLTSELRSFLGLK